MKRRPGWKSGGGLGGTRIAVAPRDARGRAALSNRQADVVQAIREHVAAHGWPPTCRELAERFRWSGPSAAKAVVDVLVAKGWVEKLPGSSRAIRVVGE
jgi:SOS-response transcriptional repressor LexA